jgi:DNA-binding response OmpR family regulator
MTPTELALMVYLLQNAARAVSREELLKNVWKFDFEADTRPPTTLSSGCEGSSRRPART